MEPSEDRFPYHRRAEMARIILGAVEERVERGQPGDRMDGLLAATEWVGDVLMDALEDAVFTTAGGVLDALGAGAVREDAEAADASYADAGWLILIKAADWSDASNDRDSIVALGAETPEAVAADAGFNRWLDRCRPDQEPEIEDLAEAGVVALAQMWPHFTRATTDQTIRWWLGPDPNPNQAPGGPEIQWNPIARHLLAAIDVCRGSDGPDVAAIALQQADALLVSCSREAALEVVEDALWGTAAWAEVEFDEKADRVDAMDAVFPRAGELWKAVEADLALAGGWYEDLQGSCDIEPLSAVKEAPALMRWTGSDRWSDEGARSYIAAALVVFTDERIDWVVADRSDDEVLDLWADRYNSFRVGPQPRQWPPAVHDG
ncbi:hypothetical protein ACFQ0K_17065 [Nocardioides caeni]|uniref:DUF4259 domain-containing protein n=1 Tax=Nocardioides caeni TaxID=574700 RepID=A0A4V4HKW3_9ACTN|nr:hypothetical protein [Nocardioides caeni]THV15976.1 hypothetical protein E9934_06460 [Nocardioides caeni]